MRMLTWAAPAAGAVSGCNGTAKPALTAAIYHGRLSEGMLLLRRKGRSRACGCGHQPDAHRHYRPGSDCALCACPQWSQRGGSHVVAAFWRPLNALRPVSRSGLANGSGIPQCWAPVLRTPSIHQPSIRSPTR